MVATTSGTESAWYLDTSAVAKLVLDEDHSAALRAWVAEHADRLVSSDLLRAELLGATRRIAMDQGDPVGEALGDDLDGLATYDTRMAEAARRHAIAVISPG